MSDAEQFTAAVPERSDPKDWRGGLERSRRKAEQVERAYLPLPHAHAARGKYRARRRGLPVVFAANRIGVNAVLRVILQSDDCTAQGLANKRRIC